MHIHFTQMSKRVVASLGDSLFVKALSCAVSVVKADRIKTELLQVQMEISVSVATNRLLWQIDLLPFCLTVSFRKMILPRLKTSTCIVAGF